MRVDIAKHDCMLIWDGVYWFPLSNYPYITDWELKKLLVFGEYEKRHGRKTEIICEEATVLRVIKEAKKNPEKYMSAGPPAKQTECTACRHGGCLTKYVCHTAPAENAAEIFRRGKILSAEKVFNKTGAELAKEPRNAPNDPPDYFSYVMLAWGNCPAGDRLVTERKLGGYTSEEDFEKNFTPGVRFFFLYEDIAKLPGFCFDGYAPAKVRDEIILKDCLYACVAPEQYENELAHAVPRGLLDKVFYLKQDGLGMWDWPDRVYGFIASQTQTRRRNSFPPSTKQ